MAEVAGSNPAGPTVLFANGGQIVTDGEHHEEEGFRNTFENTDEEPEDFLAYVNRKLKVSRAESAELDASIGRKAHNWDLQGRDLERREVEALEGLLQRERAHADPDQQLFFSKDDLERFVEHRKAGLAKKSLDWINRASDALWESTKGGISQTSVAAFRAFVLDKYSSIDSHRKVLGFAQAFLKHLSRTCDEPRYQSFDIYLELPKKVMIKRAITERIVTREDIVEVLRRIDAAEKGGSITHQRSRNYRAFTLLAAYTGLRPSTIQRLTVGQFRAALREEKPFLHVLAEQEKNRTEHYVPIAAPVADAVKAVLKHDFKGTDDTKPFFMFNSFEKWLERQKIPLPRVRDKAKGHLWLSDLRKFCQNYGDRIGWDATNQKYVLAHAMTSVDWVHYRPPLPEDVYDVYMRAWANVDLAG